MNLRARRTPLPRIVLRFAAWLILCFAGVGLAPAVLAAPAGEATSKLESIRGYMEKGQALFVSGKYQEAAEVFEAGYREHPYSAFLFNAGVAYQKLGEHERALGNFRRYLQVDPNAPDADRVKDRIAWLETFIDPSPEKAGKPAPAEQRSEASDSSMKSLVLVETDPDGAPLAIYERKQPTAKAFRPGSKNPGWEQVAAGTSPASFTLDVGRYHVVVEKFADYNRSDSVLDVLPGHVHQFKANLSQGQFMASLRVTSNVAGASVYLDDPEKKGLPWGKTPHGELVPSGQHEVLIDAPGFQPTRARVKLENGEHRELNLKLARVSYGIVRVDANTNAAVSIDGVPSGTFAAGETPLDIQLEAGSHQITIESEDHKTFSGSIDVPKGQVLPVHARMVRKYPRTAAWTQTVIASAFLGAGIYFGVESNRLYSEVEDDRNAGALQQDDDRVDRGRIFAIAADGGFAVAAILGGLATYNFLKDPYPESSISLGKLREFDEPTRAPARRPRAARPLPRPKRQGQARFRLAPAIDASSGVLSIGGVF